MRSKLPDYHSKILNDAQKSSKKSEKGGKRGVDKEEFIVYPQKSKDDV